MHCPGFAQDSPTPAAGKYSAGLDVPGNTQQTWSHWLGVRWRRGWVLFMATAHPTVSIQHYSSTGVRVKFLSIQHYYFFLEYEKFQLIDYKKVVSIQLFFIFTVIGCISGTTPQGPRCAEASGKQRRNATHHPLPDQKLQALHGASGQGPRRAARAVPGTGRYLGESPKTTPHQALQSQCLLAL